MNSETESDDRQSVTMVALKEIRTMHIFISKHQSQIDGKQTWKVSYNIIKESADVLHSTELATKALLKIFDHDDIIKQVVIESNKWFNRKVQWIFHSEVLLDELRKSEAKEKAIIDLITTQQGSKESAVDFRRRLMKSAEIAGVDDLSNLSKLITKKFHKSTGRRLEFVAESGTFFSESGGKWAWYSDMMTQEEFEKLWKEGKPPKFFTGSRDQIDPIYLGLKRCADCNQQHTKFVNCIAKRTGRKCFLCKGHGHFAVCCEDIRKHVKDFAKQLKIER